MGRPASRGQSREALRSLKSLFASPEVAWQTPWKGFLAWDSQSLPSSSDVNFKPTFELFFFSILSKMGKAS